MRERSVEQIWSVKEQVDEAVEFGVEMEAGAEEELCVLAPICYASVTTVLGSGNPCRQGLKQTSSP